MDRKPWKSTGSHRAPFGGEERGERSERASRAGERWERRAASDRSDRREFDRRDDRRHGSDRRGASDRRGWAERKGFSGERRERFGVRSGPRARALETRRFSERSDFAKQGLVRLDADIAGYFESAEAVNAALRLLIQSSEFIVRAQKSEAFAEALPSNEATPSEEAEIEKAKAMNELFDEEDEAPELDADQEGATASEDKA